MQDNTKLCLKYNNPNMDITKAKQILIGEDRLDDETLEDFIKTNSDKHIYIEVKEHDLVKNINYMKKLQELKQYDNWTLQIPVRQIIKVDEVGPVIDAVKFNAIKDCCNRFMFSDKIGNWEVLQFILSLEPIEVYITDMLGFCLPDVKKVCKDVGIRIYANWAQSAWDNSPDILKFYVRPEDLDVYNKFVSGIEFVGDTVIQEVMFNTYSRGYWYGDLAEIIIGLNTHIDSRRLPHEFGAYRVGCRKRCICGSHCGVCRAMQKFVERMEKTSTMITPKVKIKEELEK